MRPVSLRFRCFGPFMQEQFIDFARLNENGLFLICGETGAGKTSILDAMCYALYGKSSGGLRGDMDVMRCKLAGKDDETLVEFVFDIGGRRYKFVRTLRLARKNLIDEHNCLSLEGDGWIPLFANPKKLSVSRKAEELIGLSYEQFCRVIILPQGQYERLLVSDSAEKEEILVSLFGADRWQRISEELYRRVAEEDRRLQAELSQIRALLARYGCETAEAFAGKIAGESVRFKEMEKRLEGAKGNLAAARAAHEAGLQLAEKFSALESRRSRYEQLLAKLPKAESMEAFLRRADSAEGISPAHLAHRNARQALTEAEKRAEECERAARAAAEKLDGCEAEKRRHDGARPLYDKGVAERAILESARQRYGDMAAKRRGLDAANERAELCKKRLDLKICAYEEKDKAWLSAMALEKGAMEACAAAQNSYLLNIGGILAREKLKENEPCPVCGSLAHPRPAVAPAGQVSEDELNRLSEKRKLASEAVTLRAGERKAAEGERRDAEEAYRGADQARVAARSEFDALVAQKIPGIDGPAQLENRIGILKKSIERYDADEARLAGELSARLMEKSVADDGRKKSRAAREEAAARAEQQEKAWREALAASDFSSEEEYASYCLESSERDKRREAVVRFRTSLSEAKAAAEEQEKALAGREAPDMKKLLNERDEAERALEAASEERTRAAQRLEGMRADFGEAARRKSAHDERRARVDANLEFSRRLRGNAGSSLQRYVLGVMLASIAVAANRLLETVHGGRYRLYRTDEISGSARKGGLELEVLDNRNGERRSVTTLSGGEKFLVALSLAIGLSSVVQAQGGGVRLEAMFIDEGFGSLDQNSIADALEVLQGVRRAKGLVGIISHVERLKETVPAQIEILTEAGGNRCVTR